MESRPLAGFGGDANRSMPAGGMGWMGLGTRISGGPRVTMNGKGGKGLVAFTHLAHLEIPIFEMLERRARAQQSDV